MLLPNFIAVVATGGAVQTDVSKQKTHVHSIYHTLNSGQVCAFDTKCVTQYPIQASASEKLEGCRNV